MRRVLIIVAILLVPLVPIVLVVSGVIGTKPTAVEPVTLTVWGTEDETTAFTDVFAQYQSNRPYATLAYKKIPAEGYYDRLVSAWAQGTGPDLFFVPHTWIGQMIQFATPMPAQLGVQTVRTGTGLLRSGTQITVQNQPAPTLTALQNQFVDTVVDDVVIENQVWGLPMAMDTLVLYANKDLLNNAKIFEPATTWGELLNQVTNNGLTIVDEQENIVQSGVALGTIENIPHAVDILTLLMVQNGWPTIQADQERVTFNEAAKTALDFYLGFANSRKVAYSWNAQQPNALDAFLTGKVVYYIGTLHDRTAIAGSRLNWSANPMLHVSTSGDREGATNAIRVIDAARYQTLMVSKASQVQGRDLQAWNLLYFLTREEIVPRYLNATGKLSALRKILTTQRNDENIGVFASQLLTARTWYHGRGGQQAELYIQAMVDSINSGQASVDEAIKLTGEQLTSSL